MTDSTVHLMAQDAMPACEAPVLPAGAIVTTDPVQVTCDRCLRGTWYRYENGEVHDRDDRYGDTGPSCELIQMHNTWSMDCVVPTADRPNGDGRDASAICPTCEPLAFDTWGLWGG